DRRSPALLQGFHAWSEAVLGLSGRVAVVVPRPRTRCAGRVERAIGLRVAQPGPERHRTGLLSGCGLRYNEETSNPGAQTERRGEAGPVRVLLRGWDAPAAFRLIAHFTCPESFSHCWYSGVFFQRS